MAARDGREPGGLGKAIRDARTRRLDGETVEFRDVDYYPPEGPDIAPGPGRAPRPAEPAPDARLGKAAGVAGLRGGFPAGAAARGPLPARDRRRLAVVAAVAAALVFALCFFGVRALIQGLDNAGSAASSASFATDAYCLFAATDGDAGLQAAYLGYVDSINERSELCALPAGLACGTASDGSTATLASTFSSGGLEALAAAVRSLAGVEIPTAVELDVDEMARVLDLSSEGADAGEASTLAAQVWDEGQRVSEAALRGLLTCMQQIPAENHVLLDAPVEEGADGSAPTLDQESWQQLVAGLRDTTAGAGASSAS